jgi:hypothetical protein
MPWQALSTLDPKPTVVRVALGDSSALDSAESGLASEYDAEPTIVKGSLC